LSTLPSFKYPFQTVYKNCKYYCYFGYFKTLYNLNLFGPKPRCVIRSVLSSVLYCHLFRTVICSMLTSVPYCYPFRTVIRSVLSLIPSCHLFHTVILSVPLCVLHCYPFLTVIHSLLSSILYYHEIRPEVSQPLVSWQGRSISNMV